MKKSIYCVVISSLMVSVMSHGMYYMRQTAGAGRTASQMPRSQYVKQQRVYTGPTGGKQKENKEENENQGWGWNWRNPFSFWKKPSGPVDPIAARAIQERADEQMRREERLSRRPYGSNSVEIARRQLHEINNKKDKLTKELNDLDAELFAVRANSSVASINQRLQPGIWSFYKNLNKEKQLKQEEKRMLGEIEQKRAELLNTYGEKNRLEDRIRFSE